MPVSPRAIKSLYKAGQNIWLRWRPQAAQIYRDKFAATQRGEGLGYFTEITGFSPKVLDKMAESRLLMVGNNGMKNLKNATAIEKSLNNMHRGADWSEYILPQGARGYKRYASGTSRGGKIYKDRVPKTYELDDMQNLYFPTGSKVQKEAMHKRFNEAFFVPKGQRARFSRTGSGRINDKSVPK
jgi:hypothetical protein